MSDSSPTTVPPALYLQADTQKAVQQFIEELKLDEPTAIALFNAIKKGDRLTLLKYVPTLFAEGTRLSQDAKNLLPLAKSGWKTSEFWIAIVAIVSPEVERLLNKPMPQVEHIAVLVAAVLIYAARTAMKVAA